jgi:predicted methyltransferase
MRRAFPGLALVALALAGSAACNESAGTAVVAPAPAPEGRGRLFPPDELAALEAPDRAQWQQPERVMDALNIADGSHVADVGAGGGWFSAYLARRVGPNGVVYAEDIQAAMIESITRRVKSEGLTNVVPILGAPADPHLPSGLHAVLLVDTYPQLSDPVALLGRAAASLAPGGRIGIVDFKNDGAGGPGPKMEERVAPEAVMRDARLAGLTLHSQERFLRYQYMLVFTAGDGK